MRRAVIALLLVTACIRPSQPRSHGYLGGGLLTAVGAGLIVLPLLGHCERADGLYNNCDMGEFLGITLGSIIAAGGLAKLAVQLAAPTPAPAPAPVPTPAPPAPAARPDGGQPRPAPSEDGSIPAIGLLP
jgi:hypothetical protein